MTPPSFPTTLSAVTPKTAHPPADFTTDFESSVQQLRGALTELLAALGADSSAPQGMARRFGINKNLSWKVSKIVHAQDAHAAAQHIPGAAGVDILLEALERAGASDGDVAKVRKALEAYDRMVELHAGDRATLELMLSSTRPDPKQDASRKLAFQGNSAIWGVQARVRFGAQIIGLNEEQPDLLDAVSFGGYVGFRRLRATAEWPLVFKVAISADGTTNTKAWESLDPNAGDAVETTPLMPEFCSPHLPELRVADVPHGRAYVLPEGGVGNTAAIDCTFGWLTRAAAPIYAGTPDEHGAHYYPMNVPAESAQFDLFLHRDLPVRDVPQCVVYSQLENGMGIPSPTHMRYVLPLAETVQELGAPPVVATPLVPRYPQMIRAVMKRAGWNLEDFRAYRISMRYPPIPTVPALRYPLATR